MEIIDKIVKSPTEPKDTNVLWLDTINDVLKYHGDNGWEEFNSIDETSTSKEEVSSIEEFDHTTSYSDGDIVRKDRKLYKFTSEHDGEWDENDVEQTSILDIAIENGGSDPMVSITYAELKSLRDNAQLVAGQQYRITDYHTTTVQENTQSADHQFDIIVTADDEKTLNENARACLHEGDTYFSEAGAKLEAWELKYCLDNDTDRFE